MKSHAQQAADILTYISEPDSDMAVVVSLLKDMLRGFTREQAQAYRSIKPLAEYYVIQRLLTKSRKLTGSKQNESIK